MSVVKINVLTVPAEQREVLEQRFASRAGAVENSDGFEWFELLRPVEGTDQYLVYTRWRSEEDFKARRRGRGAQAPGRLRLHPLVLRGRPVGWPQGLTLVRRLRAPGFPPDPGARGCPGAAGGSGGGGVEDFAEAGDGFAVGAPDEAEVEGRGWGCEGEADEGAGGEGEAPKRPAASGSTLWSFEVVQSAGPKA